MRRSKRSTRHGRGENPHVPTSKFHRAKADASAKADEVVPVVADNEVAAAKGKQPEVVVSGEKENGAVHVEGDEEEDDVQGLRFSFAPSHRAHVLKLVAPHLHALRRTRGPRPVQHHRGRAPDAGQEV